ncbi:MAG TPA: gamma-glutamyltransferase, partial [Actinomycetota bacterium]|nr:gamma-glutamyltransferase [Actinomycetota bacterium]
DREVELLKLQETFRSPWSARRGGEIFGGHARQASHTPATGGNASAAPLLGGGSCSYSPITLDQPPSTTQAKWFPHGCVASPHYLASAAGLAVLAEGGNALDAAIATNLTLGVVTPYMCGYGGDLFAIVWTDHPYGYNGSGRAPAAATPERIREAGGGTMPTFGPLTVTVPGAVEAWFALLERFGSRTFGDLSQTALRYAREGFVVSPQAMSSIAVARERFRGYEEWQKVYGGAVEGQNLRQPDLARTIEVLCNEGPDAFYRGSIADGIVDHLQKLGGVMANDDLDGHRGEWAEPLESTYRGVEVLEMPPNSSGVTVLEALGIVEESGALPPDGPERQHLLIEAAKLALADRGAYLTDPDAMRIAAADLISADWVRRRFESIDRAHASMPALARSRPGGTAYMCAADSNGMLVSLIQSNWMGFGSGVTVPRWGVNLHNRGSYFSLDPESPNIIAPRKRTLHTLVPAMARRDGEPWLVFGTMGGDGQVQTHLQVLTRKVDDGLDVQEAISAPRWVVSPTDWSVTAESRYNQATLNGLRERGHVLSVTDPYDALMGHAHAIEVASSGFFAATDPRAEGAALGL